MELTKVKQLTEKYHSDMVKNRRHLHRHPELSYQEHETTEYIIAQLDEMGIPVDRPLDTGCVGIIEGKEADRVLALRADIDALPVREEGEHKKEFISENEGVAHCCGHDCHTANLLGAARILADLKNEIEGTVLLIFQPGEEMLPGGGRLLCETGYLQDKGVDAIFGLHSSPFLEPGEIAVREGPIMARPDEFEIEIVGESGHAAVPQDTVDPIVIASQVVGALQMIVSRNTDPNDRAVVTVGEFHGGTSYNIIPEKAELKGTVRTFSQEQAEFIEKRIEEIVEGITSAGRASYNYEFNYGYPAVINTGWTTDMLKNAAAEIIGKENIIEMEDPIMAGEDFAFYQEHFPGTFFFLGSGREETGSTYSWHHPRYNIDENCLKTGAALMASLALQPIQK